MILIGTALASLLAAIIIAYFRPHHLLGKFIRLRLVVKSDIL